MELIPLIETWGIHLIASDLDSEALGVARKGVYRQWSFRGVDPDIIKKYFFLKGDEYRVKNEHKSLVHFLNHNLVSSPPPDPGNRSKKFDLIICRNVTIYFAKETTSALASKFYHCLRDGGYLIVGHSEHSAENYAQFRSRIFPDAIVSQKAGEVKRGQDAILAPIVRNGPITKPPLRKAGTPYKTAQKSLRDFSGGAKPKICDHRGAVNKEETIIFDTAMQYYKEKKYDLSMDRFLRILDINPSNARVCWMLSHISANRGDFENSMAWGERCVEIDPLFVDDVLSVEKVQDNLLIPSPNTDSDLDVHYMSAAVRFDSELIIIFDVNNILTLEEKKELADLEVDILKYWWHCA